MLLKVRKGAKPSWRLEMIEARKVVAQVFTEEGLTVFLTSGMDGDHSAGSLHYAGYAEDFDAVKPLTSETWNRIEAEVQKRLGSPYQVLAHKGHLHVEFESQHIGDYL